MQKVQMHKIVLWLTHLTHVFKVPGSNLVLVRQHLFLLIFTRHNPISMHLLLNFNRGQLFLSSKTFKQTTALISLRENKNFPWKVAPYKNGSIPNIILLIKDWSKMIFSATPLIFKLSKIGEKWHKLKK